MKNLIVALMALCCACTLAQAKDVKGIVVYHSDGQPVVGASVSVKGTTIETLTDVDGRFVLTGLPDDVTKIRVSSLGMQPRTVSIKDTDEVSVQLKREERVVTPFIRVGIGASRPQSDENNSTDPALGFTAGAGVSFALSHYLSLTPAVLITQKTGKWEVEGGIDESGRPDYSRVFTYETTPLYLTIPLTLDLKIWSNNGNKMVVSAGPYVGFGMGGKYKVNGKEKSDLFSADADGETLYKKFDAGIQYGVGGIIRHFYIGVNGQLGLMPVNDGGMMDGCRNLFADLTIGYYF
ncbi:outer membrane beta-barrel protein [uncultured Bacteroides sp.]|uniref:porin family protein n=1 Tax=uncultured Bacteroides sp. TaxID=162156 RepID=UPI0026345EFD|nr:outer membrane beta-barrel protein [uncultured Bacteroides sp.]